MGVAVKNLILQLPDKGKDTLTPLVALDEPPARIPYVSRDEIRRLSRFLPVIILALKSTMKDLSEGPLATTGTPPSTGESNSVLGLFAQAVEQLRPTASAGALAFGDVSVNFLSMEVHRNGETVALTALEFKTLKYFLLNPRRVISRDELLNEVWGYQNYPCTRTVDNHILRLRQKLEPVPARPFYFRTVHGAGYKFVPSLG
jgi:DNA-binding winged helix-turn-helix (wHTH) protein